MQARSPDAAGGGLLEQVRVVEILFGADAAMRLYDEVRGRKAGR